MICDYCEQEMRQATGCVQITYTLQTLEDETLLVPAVKAGELNDWVEPNGRCHDCGALHGEYHHAGCDGERCRLCSGQMISCDCEYTNEVFAVREGEDDV